MTVMNLWERAVRRSGLTAMDRAAAPRPEATTVRYNPKFVFATASQPNGPYRRQQPDATALLYIHTDND